MKKLLLCLLVLLMQGQLFAGSRSGVDKGYGCIG